MIRLNCSFCRSKGSGPRAACPTVGTCASAIRGANGHILTGPSGHELVRRDVSTNAHQVSAASDQKLGPPQSLSTGRELLYPQPVLCVLSRASSKVPADTRVRLGAMNRSVTTMRSPLRLIRHYVRLGSPSLGRKGRQETLAPFDDRPRHRISDQRCATRRCVFWHRRQGRSRRRSFA